MNITLEECSGFLGGNCLCPDQVCHALQAVDCKNDISVLEFGAGHSTLTLADILQSKRLLYTRYVTYEDNPSYAIKHKLVHVILWKQFPDKLDISGDFDLVIVDGPNGVRRHLWYPLFRPLVRRGTIILIDDFDHYPEFNQALDSNFEYDVVEEVTSHSSRHRWKIVKVINPRSGQ